MKFSVQDKLALMMTGAPSQRQLAELVGVSHQRIGRWLTIGQTLPDGTPSRVREPRDPALIDAINTAFAIHVETARAQARADKIPFSAEAPVFAHRLPLIDGTPGGRVVVVNTHRITDKLRSIIIATYQQTGKFYGVSVRSTVNLKRYFKQAEKRFASRGHEYVRAKQQWISRDFIKSELKDNAKEIKESDGVYLKPIFTSYTDMNKNFHPQMVIDEINHKLRTRHEPATGERGTNVADQILFQLNSRRDPMGAEIDERQHTRELERKAKYTKARRDSQRAKRTGR